MKNLYKNCLLFELATLICLVLVELVLERNFFPPVFSRLHPLDLLYALNINLPTDYVENIYLVHSWLSLRIIVSPCGHGGH